MNVKILSSQNIMSTLWLAGGYAIRQGTQLLSFVLLARLLGADGLGAFNAILALATLVSPFVEMGGYNLIVRDIQSGVKPTVALGFSLTLTFMLMPFILIFLYLTKDIFFHNLDSHLILCIFLAELFSNRIISLVAGVNVAQGLNTRNAIIESSMGITRLAITYIMYRLGGGLASWSYAYFAQSMIFSFVVLMWAYMTWGSIPLVSINEAMRRLRDGMHFAFANSSQTASLELDKLILSSLSSFSETGIFTAAQRIVNIPNVFIFSLLTSVYPKFFELGAHGHSEVKRYAFSLLRYTLPFGFLIFIFLLFASQFVLPLLGSKFSDSEFAVKILAILIIFNCVHYPLADALTGANLQSIRSSFYIVSLIINVVLNILLIPHLGWRGAAFSTIISQGILIILLLLFTDKKEKLHGKEAL